MKVANKSGKNAVLQDKTFRWLIAIPLFVFLVKLIVIFNIESGIWYGSDTESYIEGGNALLLQGLNSDNSKLTYLPAGYSFILFFFAKISVLNFSYILSVFQSLVFGFATFSITNTIYKLGNSRWAILSSLVISLNLTLSLSSMVIGYENLVASLIAFAASVLINNADKTSLNKQIKVTIISMACISLASALQPRYLLVGFGIITIYSLYLSSIKNKVLILILGFVISIIFPVGLMVRNHFAIGHTVVSYNLGATMKIGAGPDTKGGFLRLGREIDCGDLSEDPVLADRETVKCISKWYLSHPVDFARLSFNKSIYYWSPWFGALAEGTMARNPWVSISPVVKMAANPESRPLVLGFVGKTISYLWILSQLFFLVIGFRLLSKSGESHKLLASISGIVILFSWFTSIGTIGDHRFRLPAMILSLLLQSIGISRVFDRIFKAV